MKETNVSVDTSIKETKYKEQPLNIKKINVILPVFFILTIVSSIFVLPTNINEVFAVNERRKLSEFPSFTITEIGNYIDKIDRYFSDHFGGRSLFISTYCYLKFNVLGISPYPKEVLVGKDDWLYLGDNKSSILSEHLGLKMISPKALSRMKKNVMRNKKWAEQQGIKYYMFIAPDKYTIYPEYLPSGINQKTVSKNLDKIIKAFNPEIPIIDVRARLKAYKDKEKLYAKADSHWNDFGAFLAYQQITRTMAEDFPSLKSSSIKEFDIIRKESKHKTTGDMINAQHYIQDEEILFKPKHPPDFQQITNKLPIPKNLKRNAKNYEVRYQSKKNKKLKIIVFRDSFSNRLRKFLSNDFSESIYIQNNHKFSRKLIELEKPDIILHEMVERGANEVLLRY